MIDGIYKVVSWNGKDGHLVNDKDEMVTLSKQELPSDFRGFLIPDEIVECKAGVIVSLMKHFKRIDINVRFLMMSSRIKELMEKEIERRARYGAAPGLVDQ